MPKRIKHPKRPTDVNQLAHHLVEQSTAESEMAPEIAPVVPASLSAYMAAIGRKGGKIGGKRRLETMSDAKRQRMARNAAKARWDKVKKPDQQGG